MISYLLIFYQTQAIFFYYLITQKIITHHLPSLFQRRLKIRGRFFHLPRAFHNFFADECITIGRKGKKINRPNTSHRTRVTRFKFQTRQTPMAANRARFNLPQSLLSIPSNHSNGKPSIKRRLCRDYSSTNRPSRIINGIFDDLGGAWLESTSSDAGGSGCNCTGLRFNGPLDARTLYKSARLVLLLSR